MQQNNQKEEIIFDDQKELPLRNYKNIQKQLKQQTNQQIQPQYEYQYHKQIQENYNYGTNQEYLSNYDDKKMLNENQLQQGSQYKNNNRTQYENRKQKYYEDQHESEKADQQFDYIPYQRNQFYRNKQTEDYQNQQKNYNNQEDQAFFSTPNKLEQQNYTRKQQQQGEVIFRFQTKFLRANNYQDIEELRTYFEPLKHLNEGIFPPENSYFVLIRPKGYYNLHKAIKYGIWTSMPLINKNLSNLYNDSQMRVFLIFYPLGENSYLTGIAEMTGDYKPQASFKYWDKEGRYFGNFSIIWHYIKDVDPTQIPQLCFQTRFKRAFYEISLLKDGTQIHYDDALNIFKAFAKTPNLSSIFQLFNNLDIQEDNQRSHKQQQPLQSDFQTDVKTIKKQYKY